MSSLVPQCQLCDIDESNQCVLPSSKRPMLGSIPSFHPEECTLTEERKCEALRYSKCKLNLDELSKLKDIQHHITVEDETFSHDELIKTAEKEEKARDGIKQIHLQMLQAAIRGRFGKDDAMGVLLDDKNQHNDSDGIYNSLLMGPREQDTLVSQLESLEMSFAIAANENTHDNRDCHDSLYKRRIGGTRTIIENRLFDVEDCSHVRKPNITKIIENQDSHDRRRPKYTLRNLLLSRRFHLYKHRFANAQHNRTLLYPTLPQPDDEAGKEENETKVTEKKRTRCNGHRFIIAADTQFGILMDGFAMENPSWNEEIEISRKAVAKINAMEGSERPLFVCVCGDLVDTESSFTGALASWKKIMTGWERSLIFDQQVKDFKRVWSRLDPDIALVCLCGNHDVGNRPTRASIERWTSSLGDDYVSFWVNGTFNIALNNCLFSNPTGAPDMFEEQLKWLEKRLQYAQDNKATHIFVYSHFPWFLRHEDETDEEVVTFSGAPPGWGPEGTKFPDNYFTIPFEERQMALLLFRKYGVTACFSGHFHQNVIAKTSWGMDMIVTGALSMSLESGMSSELSGGEVNGIGMRAVDVGETGKFTHKWFLLDEDTG